MTKPASADEIWRQLVSYVMETREDWRRRVHAATGLPFGRVRVLRRLVDGPRTLADLADATGSDAPATTVMVNDLETRGLARRQPHPTNRRAKLVSLTPQGRALLARARRVIEKAPVGFESITAADIAALGRVVTSLQGALDASSGGVPWEDAKPPRNAE